MTYPKQPKPSQSDPSTPSSPYLEVPEVAEHSRAPKAVAAKIPKTHAATEPEGTSEGSAPATTQVTATVELPFLADFDTAIRELGYSRADAIREGMRRIRQECLRIQRAKATIAWQQAKLDQAMARGG